MITLLYAVRSPLQPCQLRAAARIMHYANLKALCNARVAREVFSVSPVVEAVVNKYYEP